MEEKNELAGRIALLFGDYDSAQELFLRSMTPTLAMDMRCDLLQWELALKLAKTLAPDRVCGIAIKRAQQLEFRGDYSSALAMFKQTLAEVRVFAFAPTINRIRSHSSKEVRAVI